nr:MULTISPECIES: hypothetical protein [Sorangium]
MAEELLDLLQRPAASTPARDEGGRAGVPEVVPADRPPVVAFLRDDARGGEVLLPVARSLRCLPALSPRARPEQAVGVLLPGVSQAGHLPLGRLQREAEQRDATDLAALRRLVLLAEPDHDIRPRHLKVYVPELKVPLFRFANTGPQGERREVAIFLRDVLAGQQPLLLLRHEVRPRVERPAVLSLGAR